MQPHTYPTMLVASVQYFVMGKVLPYIWMDQHLSVPVLTVHLLLVTTSKCYIGLCLKYLEMDHHFLKGGGVDILFIIAFLVPMFSLVDIQKF